MNIPPELVLLFLVLTIYWTFLGSVQIFKRENLILVVIYIIFLFPIAYIHMFIIGVSGPSRKKRILMQEEQKLKQTEGKLVSSDKIDCLVHGELKDLRGKKVRISRTTDNF
jgi:hypothetical protein